MNQDQVITAISISVLAIMTALWLLRRVKIRRARNWPSVNGEIESTSVILDSGGSQPGSAAYYAEVEYSFTVSGQDYCGVLRRRFLLKGKADKWIAGYTRGQLTVRYNPNAPKDSVLLEGDQTPAAEPFSVRSSVILLAAMLCLPCCRMDAQASNSNYTADMPSVERVKAEIQGKDPTDTLARQVAVFTYLSAYIQRIKYNRTVRGPYTPDEQRVMASYDLSAYQISQSYAKSHTAEEVKAFERLHGQYEMDGAFRADWTKRLMGPQSIAAYKGAEAGLAAAGQRRYDQAMADYKRDSAAQQAADKQIFGNAQGLSNDPTAVAARRCLELGGSNAGCVGHGLMSGFKDLIGFTPEVEEEMMGPGGAGVILQGLYKNPATTATLAFSGNVVIGGCGKLVADGHGYTIDKRPGSVRITVENEPNPIVLTMRPDGGLTGPGLVDVKGRIIIGYHTETKTLYRDGVPAAPGTCDGPCSTSVSVPDYAPAMARCVIGSLAMPPSPKPAPAPAQPANDSGIMGLVTGLTDMLDPGHGAHADGEVGLRMVGKYGGGMLLLDFSSNFLVLDCGQAHVRAPYTVENAPNAFLIHVQNSGGPFTLAFEPDNTLRGAGSTTVNGKLVTGMKGDDITFAPHSETCDVGTFRPKTGATQTASVATASPAPVPAATSSIATVSAPSPAAAGVTLSITASFSTGVNPLAGHPVFLMSDRFDIALRKAGAPIPASTTPGKALQAWTANCLPPRECKALVSAMKQYYLGKAMIDSSGKATLIAPVPPGSYFVFGGGRNSDGGLVWDVPVTLKAGDNAITLTASNAELIRQ